MKINLPILALCALIGGWVGAGKLSAVDVLPINGAEVDEGKVELTYYVDAAAPDSPDGGQGTQVSPFKTIAWAFEAAAHAKDSGKGVKIIIADGIYREVAIFPEPANGKPDTDAPLVIEAANRQQAIIEGANVSGWEAATWKRDSASWTHEWIKPEGILPNLSKGSAKLPNEIARRPELIFFNGVAIRQVLTPQEVVPGFFCVMNPIEPTAHRRGAALAAASGVGMATLQPPDGADAEGAQIEVSVRGGGLAIRNRRNVVVRGLVVQHISNYASDLSAALTFKGCSNVLVEDTLCQWNNGVGLSMVGRTAAPWSNGITLRRVQLLNNGGSGLIASSVKGFLAEDCETSFNNFRGDWSGWVDAAGPAGCKVSGIHGGVWRRHHAVGNWCRGLWWGGDCTNITLEDSTLRNNLVGGLFIENNPGPVSVRRCVINGTKSHPSVRDGAAYPAAVSICATPDVTLESCIVSGNTMPQLGLWDVAQRADGVNFETKTKETLRAERHVYRHNVFSGLDSDQPLFNLPVADRSGKGTFDFFYNSLSGNENCFWNPVRVDAFCTYDKTSYYKPGVAFDDWRSFLAARAATGKPPPEAESIWRDPLFMDPSEGDFRMKAASPVLDWGLPYDERASE